MLQHRTGMYNYRSCRQVSACKNNNPTKPLGKYVSLGIYCVKLQSHVKRCNRIEVPLLHLLSLVNNFSKAANQQ
ncbi:hypothetical protein BT93_C2474 [Corymbia citriodora subsp. variegata]|nr:hypothetical protein BT93_C2474 [Corymbia citriodora subsp. variegata]